MRLLGLLCSFLISALNAAGAYTPAGKPKQQAQTHLYFRMGLIATRPLCKTTDVPTWEQLKTKKFETHMQIMTASQAASLNITWGGSASVTYNADQLLAVSDTSRVAPCLAADGKTVVYYGDAIRTIVAMNDYAVKGNASIAVVAATATANGKTNSVDLYEIGYGDPQLDVKLVAAKQTLGGSGIQIENYQDFIKAYAAAEAYAAAIQKPGIDVVGYDFPLGMNDYRDVLADAWALQNIAQGYGCLDAIKNFREKDERSQDDIRNTYDQVAGGCGVDAVGKAKAAQVLNGLKIKY